MKPGHAAGVWRPAKKFIAALAVFALLLPAPEPARGALPETAAPSPLPAESRNWRQIPTQNAGVLSLPPDWIVVSQDEPPERSPEADLVYNVQQALYAKPGDEPAGQGAGLQIFSIWAADREEKVLPLSGDLTQEAGGDFVAGLIGARYGSVARVGEDTVRTDLEDLFAVTYSAGPQTGESGFHYKRATLFHGEKQVLVLIKYLPEYEDYWRERFAALLNAWVASLTLTPRPMGDRTAAWVSLPAAAPPPEAAPSPDAVSSPDTAPSPEPSQAQNPASDFILNAGIALSAFALFFACAGGILAWRRNRRADAPSQNGQAGPANRESAPDAPPAEEAPAEEEPIEEEAVPPAQEALGEEEPEADNEAEEAQTAAEDATGIEAEIKAEIEAETETEIEAKDEEPKPSEPPLSAEDLVLPFLNQPDPEARPDPASGKPSFDKVYTILNQALFHLDTGEALPEPGDAALPLPPETETAESLTEALNKTMDGLEESFGRSYALETLRLEAAKSVALAEREEKSPVLPAKDAEGFILKLCCGALVSMLQTGRYHVGKGVLNSEGQELVDLFEHLNDLRLIRSHSTPEEAAKDASFIQYCVRQLG